MIFLFKKRFCTDARLLRPLKRPASSYSAVVARTVLIYAIREGFGRATAEVRSNNRNHTMHESIQRLSRLAALRCGSLAVIPSLFVALSL